MCLCVCKDPYTLHLSSAEDAWQKKHLDRDGHDENKRESQRCHSRHDRPEDSQTDHLYRSVQMHPQGPHLRIQSQKFSQDTAQTSSTFHIVDFCEVSDTITAACYCHSTY